MEKKEQKKTEKEMKCNCEPDCTCGCQEGGECHCGDACHYGCGCPCKKKVVKILAIILIFALGFCTAKMTGCRPCLHGKLFPKVGIQAPMPMAPGFTDGSGNTIIIINTDGAAETGGFMKHHHDQKGCTCGCDKCGKHAGKHGKWEHHQKPEHFEKQEHTLMPTAAQPDVSK